MKTVVIVGSHRWKDYDAFCEAMPALGEYDRIVSGGQVGVDKMAEMLAGAIGIEFKCFPILSRDPTPVIRNQRIVDAADAMIAFPGPRSTGTWDAVRRAKKKGIPVVELKAPV